MILLYDVETIYYLTFNVDFDISKTRILHPVSFHDGGHVVEKIKTE